MSPTYLILLVLLFTGLLLTMLLLPLPSFGTRILLSFLQKLNSPLLFYPTRLLVGFVLISFFFSFTEMTKYQDRGNDAMVEGLAKTDLHISRWRSERNFYLHCFCVTLMCITWAVQNLVYTNHKLEEELTKLQSSPAVGSPARRNKID
eukprot:TRINITY_DN880_c0_g1_i3.p1 TRINITY_DN880_c0_g1~~TRINITY_DN880_c0_g1_i3.p1  ORF type:complete len:157 (+),score=17.87 TRINITY_DN880_c0_g1_i3:28-471(+)